MFITTDKRNYNPVYYKLLLLRYARIRVLAHKMGATERCLEKYLKQHFGIKLKSLCLLLLSNANIEYIAPDNIIITFKTNYFEQLARLITYGNGVFIGSDILKNALKDISEPNAKP